jgi:hypothetical protein
MPAASERPLICPGCGSSPIGPFLPRGGNEVDYRCRDCGQRWTVTECHSIFKAEDVYTLLLREDPSLSPERGGMLTTVGDARAYECRFRVVPNAVWRSGRVFLSCPVCERPCTRLYLPLKDSWLACRQCWGLTYRSRQQNNYKDGGPRWFPIVSFRDLAQLETSGERERRAEAARNRWAERRQIRAAVRHDISEA